MQTVLFMLALVVANGLFSAAEIAVVSVRRSRVRQLMDEGDPRARRVDRLHSQTESFLATVQVGITIVGALGAAIGGAQLAQPIAEMLRAAPVGALSRSAEGISLGIVVVVYSFVSIVVGELIPKSIALRYAEPLALGLARPMIWLRSVARPLVWLLTGAANMLLRPLHDRTRFTEARLSPEEIRLLVDEAARTGGLDKRRAEIIERAVDFGERTVAEVLIPRAQMVTVERSASFEQIRQTLLEQGHTRMPVTDGSIDRIVGYISAKDVLALAWEKELIVVEDIIRPAFFVPQTMDAVDLLRALQRRHEHMAIVVDEYGGTAGLCTTEDLVEEIVGEIFGEGEREPELIRREADGTAVLAATLPVREFNRAFDAAIPEDADYDTVGGFITHLAGAIPSLNQSFRDSGFEFVVSERTERLVKQVRVRRLPEASREDDEREREPEPKHD